MQRIQLASTEIDEINGLLSEVLQNYSLPFSGEFLTDLVVWSHQLPVRLRQELNRLRFTDNGNGVMVVSGFPINNHNIGPTPPRSTLRPLR